MTITRSSVRTKEGSTCLTRCSSGPLGLQRARLIHPQFRLIIPLVPLLLAMLLVQASHAFGQERMHSPEISKSHHHTTAPNQWEGSPEGVVFSQFNHRLAGFAVILVGLTELRSAIGLSALVWLRFLAPIGLLGFGVYLMICSDHVAWPIGPLSLAETLSGGNPEMLQHKLYAVLLLLVGMIELLRQMGRLTHVLWRLPLPAFAIIGGLMLFLHSHGDHPAAHWIFINHSIMGVLALTAASCWLVSQYKGPAEAKAEIRGTKSTWMVTWAGCILLIGGQLLIYSE